MAYVQRCKPLLGTFVDIYIEADYPDEITLELSIRAFNAVERVHKLMGFHSPESEVSAINRLNPDEPLKISSETLEVLQLALELSDITDGLFDICVGASMVANRFLPKQDGNASIDLTGNFKDISLDHIEKTITLKQRVCIDLGGIAKGFAVDQVFKELETENISQMIVNAGGDLRMLHFCGERVALRPHRGSGSITLKMVSPALASSANTFSESNRASFIITPETGHPLEDSRCISIHALTCMQADALTKVCFLVKEHQLRDDILEKFEASLCIN
ncbi:MAG: FAD:protein FMN transferase [Rubritalea sp.]|uniref:FAD:protein FMN transferase n=1 Tax=Rubritalea sp. TaxID=2109375 RepID=UPI003242AB2A